MSNTVIRVENISKQYRLGEVSTGTIMHDVNRWWYKIRGKENPYLLVGEENDRTTKGSSEYVWALQDINFGVKEGEVLGIIGRNGAGKSTLLKILSKVTQPTSGSIKVKGRIASLLEVGTGFHPELSGRDNIYLNGAILGMTRREIQSKFDEIVDFSGVERYIDTPVKRYSSGMYVRLAFAVAAHLEPEILVVDEVLAVGDADFQKKCFGKMKESSEQTGRTILFVSHNLSAINTLCKNSVYLKNGLLHSLGSTNDIITTYVTEQVYSGTHKEWPLESRPGDSTVKISQIRLIDKNHQALKVCKMHEPFGIEMEYEILDTSYCPVPNMHVTTVKGEIAFLSSEAQDKIINEKGKYKTISWIPENLMNEETYMVRVAISTMSPVIIHADVLEALVFEVVEDQQLRNTEITGRLPGVVRPVLKWETVKLK